MPQSGGIPHGVVEDVRVVPFNDPDALECALAPGDVACFIVEPVMENIGICLPDDGYLVKVRDITQRHGTLLIFDEVKTGITAGFGGATNQLGVRPDLITLAKSIGGGFPVGAFGGKAEYMNHITDGSVLHLGLTTAIHSSWLQSRQRWPRRAQRKLLERPLSETLGSFRRARRSSIHLVSRHTRCSLVPRVASRGQRSP